MPATTMQQQRSSLKPHGLAGLCLWLVVLSTISHCPRPSYSAKDEQCLLKDLTEADSEPMMGEHILCTGGVGCVPRRKEPTGWAHGAQSQARDFTRLSRLMPRRERLAHRRQRGATPMQPLRQPTLRDSALPAPTGRLHRLAHYTSAPGGGLSR